MWLKVNKGTGMHEDIFIATCYLSPAREKGNSDSKISKLSEEVMSFQQKGHVIINGDLNAWTGVACDIIKSDKFDDKFHVTNREVPPAGNSKHKIANKRGTELLDMCKSLELYIMNGRTVGDPFGEFTSLQPPGKR